MEEIKIAKVGDPVTTPPQMVFELVINDHIKFVDPKTFGLDLIGINPVNYFVTSGDAIEKAKVLNRDLVKLNDDLLTKMKEQVDSSYVCQFCGKQAAGSLYVRLHVKAKHPELLEQYDKSHDSRRSGIDEYKKAVEQAVVQSAKLIAALRTAKGENCFLETEWDNHSLLCIPKNPRR